MFLRDRATFLREKLLKITISQRVERKRFSFAFGRFFFEPDISIIDRSKDSQFLFVYFSLCR